MQLIVVAQRYAHSFDFTDDEHRPLERWKKVSRKPRSSPNEATSLPKVFVVEDDRSVRSAIARLLMPMQCAVRTFASAEQFLAEVPPDSRGCLILDLRLPGMTGLQLLKQLAREQWKLSTIVISAELGDTGEQDAL